MRPSLERIGRFDPERARARFRDTFRPKHTRLILDLAERLTGCVAFGPYDGALLLEHFYLVPEAQGRGVGSAVLRCLMSEADASAKAIRLDVLRGLVRLHPADAEGIVHVVLLEIGIVGVASATR